MTDITLFDNEKELTELTGLNHKQLWDAGFNLDDWDWGFRSKNDLDHLTIAEWRIVDFMEGYCCGYDCVKYNGYYYYMQYHA